MIVNSGLTLYNKCTNIETDEIKYLKTYIEEANFQVENIVAVTDKGLNSANKATIFIPMDNNFQEKTYKKPVEFRRLDNSEKINFFTFQEGDIVVKGLCDFELSGRIPNDINTLKNACDDVYSIISVGTNDYGSSSMHHWEVGAK